MSFKDQLYNLLRGSFPLIQINSREYDRVLEELSYLMKNGDSFLSGYKVSYYSTADCRDEIEIVLNDFSEMSKAILVVKNLNLFWDDPYRRVRIIDGLYKLYQVGLSRGVHLINISTAPILPELADYFVVIDYPLPDEATITSIVKSFINEYEVRVDDINEIVNLCKGMSKAEIDNALTLAYLSSENSINLQVLKEEKARIVRKTGLLEWIEDVPSIDEIGGLENLKNWFQMVAKVFHNPVEAMKYGLKVPKGCLLCGLAGTGKTLSAKAIASLFKLPLFRLDVGKLFGSLVGETERNTREVLRLIDAVSPCVVLIDEIEKALAGLHSSSHTDSGVTARLIGSFLYYLQEKKTFSYFVATANDINVLPPELLRKGRFDEIWYVGLPTARERYYIWKIHLAKAFRDINQYDYRALVRATHNFTGAEIEAVIQQTLYRTFYENREPTTQDFLDTIQNITPFAVLKKDYVVALERWAIENKVRRANANEEAQTLANQRKILN